jgi:PAS domain S-box-containing protein
MVDKLEPQIDSSGFMQALFESAPDAIIVVDAKGSIARLNAQTETMFQYERDELLGQPLEMLIPERYRSQHAVHKTDYFSTPRPRQMGAELDLFARRKDGTEFPVDIMLSPLHATQGLMAIAVVRDITQRKAAEHALRQSEEIFRLMVTAVKDYAIFMLDSEGHVATWNEGAERFKQYKAEEIIGKHFSIFYSEEDRLAGKPQNELAEATASGRCEDIGWRTRKDGSRFWADVIISAFKDKHGAVIGFSKVTRDITEQKRAEEHLQAIMQQREDFVATLTHDLKTPVFAANRAIKLMLDGDYGSITDDQKEVLNMIHESNDSMYRLLLTLLDVYRYDSGAKQLVITQHDLAQSVRKLLRELQTIAQARGITLHDEMPEEAIIDCDPEEVRRVVQNLIDNALKFTQPGGSVSVRVERANEATRVMISDTGKGIANEDMPKLFERFWAPAASGRQYASTGLGLYLCRKIVEGHGGKIWCESTPGAGSKFYFTIARQWKK